MGALVHDAEGFPLLHVHPCMETHDTLKFFAPKAIRLLFFCVCGKRGNSVYKDRHGELYTAQSQNES